MPKSKYEDLHRQNIQTLNFFGLIVKTLEESTTLQALSNIIEILSHELHEMWSALTGLRILRQLSVLLQVTLFY